MKRIAVVGGGFAGLMTAYHLLHSSERPVRVDLFNKGRKLPLGAAYSTDLSYHLLNVSADKMSALPEAPAHFAEWLIEHYPDYGSEDLSSVFAPRKIYGEYLTDIYNGLRSTYPNFKEYDQEVEAIESKGEGYSISDTEYSSVVLATGNLLPRQLYEASAHSIDDPWNFEELRTKLTSTDQIFILGTGLSMVDVLVFLENEKYQKKIIALSSNGMIPHAHSSSETYPPYLDELNNCKDLNQIYSVVKKHLKKAAETGLELHSVIDVLRPYAQHIWTRLSETDHQRFLRHLKHGWNVLRHRIPQSASACIERFHRNKQLEVRAGKISSIVNGSSGLNIGVKLKRGAGQVFENCLLINCSGPLMDYKNSRNKLFPDLFQKGLAFPGPLGIGIKANYDGELLSGDNQIIKNIYTLGSGLRSVLWETTAVNELRNQAKKLAKRICILQGLIS